jgi:hypothetical protein
LQARKKQEIASKKKARNCKQEKSKKLQARKKPVAPGLDFETWESTELDDRAFLFPIPYSLFPIP